NASSTFWVSTAGSIIVTAVGDNGCENSSDPIQITESPLPQKPVVSSQNGNLVSSVSSGTIQWFDQNGVAIVGETSAVFENAPNGIFYVVVTDPNTGCSNQSDLFTGILEINGKKVELRFVPNPVSKGDFFELVGSDAVKSVSIFNMLGEKVLEVNGTRINTGNLSTGMYHVIVKAGNGSSYAAGKIQVK
ncbi:MAG: T9SS type A sorting domain-containing protein, partial [Luteibaculum sp.]